MSEQEQKSGGGAGGSPVVVVEQSATSRHKQPFRPTELQDDSSDLHHKRSRAPAVSSAVTEKLKESIESVDDKERRESERAMSIEKSKQSVAKKLSSSTKKRGSPPEVITVPIELQETKIGKISPSSQPIQIQDTTVSDETNQKSALGKKEEEDSITEEIAEMRSPETDKKMPDWNEEDDAEAGGLRDSESRASRVSRAVRQLLCCGVRYEAPSEHRLSPREYDAI